MKLSVVIPSFNQGPFLAKAIESVVDYAPAGTELIVMDGGSRDNSVEVLSRYAAKIAYWESQPDKGQSDALNRGFARSTGDIMAWLCADDYYLPGGPMAMVDWFRTHPGESWAYGEGTRIDVHGATVEPLAAGAPTFAKLVDWCYVFTPACFWRRTLWEKSGAHVDESLDYTMDWELMLRFAQHARPHHLEIPVTAVRDHADSKTVLARYESHHLTRRNREIAQISRRHGGWFSYNSLAYPLARLALLRDRLPERPRWLNRSGFFLLHLPLRILRRLFGNPFSNLA